MGARMDTAAIQIPLWPGDFARPSIGHTEIRIGAF
jgi:hypothetical protein